MRLLVPSDPLQPRSPEELFAVDADAARAAGWTVSLVDHDALCAGDARGAVRRVKAAEAAAVYRGWMVTSQQYADLTLALQPAGIEMCTTPQQYQRAHELPGWYGSVTGLTPHSAWTEGNDVEEFLELCSSFGGRLVLRDFVKSEKHYWKEAALIEDATDSEQVRRIAERFLELRGSDFVGGLVARRYENFAGPEARTWWVGGRCVLVTAHPDTPTEQPMLDVPAPVSEAVQSLDLAFATADLVRGDGGAWRVVEIGDGQVSGAPPGWNIQDILTSLVAAS